MVTDAAGTGFEIKKPHKGTETLYYFSKKQTLLPFEIKKPHKEMETSNLLYYYSLYFLFGIEKPHKGTETLLNKCKHTPNLYLELGNPMRGQNPLFTYE